MDLKDVVYSRRPVRAYKPAAVDETTIGALIDAAIQAPSAVNEQPWSFTVVGIGPCSRVSRKPPRRTC